MINHKTDSVTLVDVKRPSVAGTVAVSSSPPPPGDGRLFVNAADKRAIAVIDVPKSTLIKSMQITGCSDPWGLAYDKDADLLMSVCGNGVTKFLHSDGKAVSTLKTGPGSDSLVFGSLAFRGTRIL